MTPEQKIKRATVAALTRHHPSDPVTARLQAEFRAERLEEYIRRVVDAAPPMTPDMLSRLRVLLQNPDTAAVPSPSVKRERPSAPRQRTEA